MSDVVADSIPEGGTINKVVYGNETLIDLTGDDVTAADVLSGKKFHLPTGAEGTGTCTYDATTTDATAVASDILSTKTAYAKGSKLTGTMTNNGGVTGTISTVNGEYSIPVGYHDGSGKITISTTEQAKIIATNIRSGVTILGVPGSMSTTEGLNLQTGITVTSSVTTDQSIEIDTEHGYNGLGAITVYKVPRVNALNDAGGYTVTIG